MKNHPRRFLVAATAITTMIVAAAVHVENGASPNRAPTARTPTATETPVEISEGISETRSEDPIPAELVEAISITLDEVEGREVNRTAPVARFATTPAGHTNDVILGEARRVENPNPGAPTGDGTDRSGTEGPTPDTEGPTAPDSNTGEGDGTGEQPAELTPEQQLQLWWDKTVEWVHANEAAANQWHAANNVAANDSLAANTKAAEDWLRANFGI